MLMRSIQVTMGEFWDGRTVALMVQTAGRYQSDIHVSDGTRRMNAKSLMGMMAFGLSLGSRVTIEVAGPDEAEAMDAMISFFEGK